MKYDKHLVIVQTLLIEDIHSKKDALYFEGVWRKTSLTKALGFWSLVQLWQKPTDGRMFEGQEIYERKWYFEKTSALITLFLSMQF